MKTKKRIAVYTDSLLGKGGGSRVALQIAEFLQADIITLEFDSELLKWQKFNNKIITIGSFTKKFNISFFRLFESPIRFLFLKDYNYDINIFIGTSSIFASRNTKNNIWFCFTPDRIMYDLRDWKMENSSLINKIIFSFHNLLFRFLDQWIVKSKIDFIVSQTLNVKNRVKKYYGRDSKVIYSPVETNKFHFKTIGDYFLTASRLVPEKRINLLIHSFNEMPSKKLIIVGKGPEEEKLRNLIKDSKQIQIITNANDEELIKLYANCLATIYFPIDEDFGLIPVESMASGKPCIAANEGGCLETVINGKTGFLIEANTDSITAKINLINKEMVNKMQIDCISQAKNFDILNIKKQWLDFLEVYE